LYLFSAGHFYGPKGYRIQPGFNPGFDHPKRRALKLKGARSNLLTRRKWDSLINCGTSQLRTPILRNDWM